MGHPPEKRDCNPRVENVSVTVPLFDSRKLNVSDKDDIIT